MNLKLGLMPKEQRGQKDQERNNGRKTHPQLGKSMSSSDLNELDPAVPLAKFKSASFMRCFLRFLSWRRAKVL